MKKNTILMILFSFLFVIILGVVLYMFAVKEKTVTFYAEIKEVYNKSYLVSPLANEKIYDKFKEINIIIDTDYQVGDIIIIKAESEVLLTSPVTMNLISHEPVKTATTSTATTVTTTVPVETPNDEIKEVMETTNPKPKEEISYVEDKITEDALISQFTNYLSDVNNNKNKPSFKEKAKNNFITIIDFIFYDKEVSGYKFKNLTNKAKLKIVSIALNLDDATNKVFPNYKTELSSSYQNAKSKLISYYMSETSKFCENNDDVCAQAKADLALLKKSLNLSWSFIVSIKDVGVNELQKWYEIFSGK